MTLHLEWIHICHILKQWHRRPYQYSLSAKRWDENIGQNGLEGICMVEADTHVVWDQFNTEGPKGPNLHSRGRSYAGSRKSKTMLLEWLVAPKSMITLHQF